MRPEIERKGDANSYTAVNGNMFTILLGSERLGSRLPEEERAKFLKAVNWKMGAAPGARQYQSLRPSDFAPASGRADAASRRLVFGMREVVPLIRRNALLRDAHSCDESHTGTRQPAKSLSQG
jgi:hypothetical protein